MSKCELVSAVKEVICDGHNAEDIVDSIINTIVATLTDGTDVILSGFGTFKIKTRKARIGRNPATGESVKISAKKVVTFKPAKQFKEEVNE